MVDRFLLSTLLAGQSEKKCPCELWKWRSQNLVSTGDIPCSPCHNEVLDDPFFLANGIGQQRVLVGRNARFDILPTSRKSSNSTSHHITFGTRKQTTNRAAGSLQAGRHIYLKSTVILFLVSTRDGKQHSLNLTEQTDLSHNRDGVTWL